MTDEQARAVEDALKAVRDLDLDPESPGGAVILSHLLGQAPSLAARRTHVDAPEQVGTDREHELSAALVAEWVGVDVDRIEDVIEFTADEPLLRIPSGRLPRAKADRQRALVLIKLAVERVAYDRTDVPARGINATCADYACMDQNLAHNVSSRGDLATRRGKRGAYIYRVTQPGLQRAKGLLHDLFEGEEELQV